MDDSTDCERKKRRRKSNEARRETHAQSCLPKYEKQPAVTLLFCLSWQQKPHSAERGLWQELHLILQSSQQKANVKLRERTTEDEMAGWHHRLDRHGFGCTPEAGDRQGGLACCGSWGLKESDMTE